jgi:hypothetical protein
MPCLAKAQCPRTPHVTEKGYTLCTPKKEASTMKLWLSSPILLLNQVLDLLKPLELTNPLYKSVQPVKLSRNYNSFYIIGDIISAQELGA